MVVVDEIELARADSERAGDASHANRPAPDVVLYCRRAGGTTTLRLRGVGRRIRTLHSDPPTVKRWAVHVVRHQRARLHVLIEPRTGQRRLSPRGTASERRRHARVDRMRRLSEGGQADTRGGAHRRRRLAPTSSSGSRRGARRQPLAHSVSPPGPRRCRPAIQDAARRVDPRFLDGSGWVASVPPCCWRGSVDRGCAALLLGPGVRSPRGLVAKGCR